MTDLDQLRHIGDDPPGAPPMAWLEARRRQRHVRRRAVVACGVVVAVALVGGLAAGLGLATDDRDQQQLQVVDEPPAATYRTADVELRLSTTEAPIEIELHPTASRSLNPRFDDLALVLVRNRAASTLEVSYPTWEGRDSRGQLFVANGVCGIPEGEVPPEPVVGNLCVEEHPPTELPPGADLSDILAVDAYAVAPGTYEVEQVITYSGANLEHTGSVVATLVITFGTTSEPPGQRNFGTTTSTTSTTTLPR